MVIPFYCEDYPEIVIGNNGPGELDEGIVSDEVDTVLLVHEAGEKGE